MSWLNYLQSMFGQQGGDATDQQPYQTAGLGWAGPPSYDQAAALQRHLIQPAGGVPLRNVGNFNPADVNGPGPGNVGQVDVSGGAPAQGPPGYLNSTSATPAPDAPVSARPTFSGVQPGLGAPNYTNPFLAAGATPGAGLSAPALIRSPSGATTTPGAGPLSARPGSVSTGSTGGASGVGAASNPRNVDNDRFKLLNYDVSGGGKTPYISALNLGSLFGGGQQAAANPANVPAPTAQAAPARIPGPLSQNVVNRLAANYPGRLNMSPAQLANYFKTQPWLANLGGAAAQQMTPDQLAAAVHKPNWYRNV